MTGFTGVAWDTRTTEQLACDLCAGPGPAELTEAGLAWARASAELVEAGASYAAVLEGLRARWQSAHAEPVLEKLGQLRVWFADTAGDAAGLAAQAQAQAAAATVARLAMPDSAEVDLVDGLHTLATSVSDTGIPGVATAMAGAAAQAERAMHEQRQRAARVMTAYEAAAEPAGNPWRTSHPAPELVSPDALRAQLHPDAGPTGSATAPPSPPPSAGLAGRVGIPEPARTRYTSTALTSAHQPPGPTGTAGVASGAGAPMASSPGAAPPVVPGMSPANPERVSARPAADGCADEQAPPQAAAGAQVEAAAPTWADLAVADTPAAEHVCSSGDGRRVDPRYESNTLMLGGTGDRR